MKENRDKLKENAISESDQLLTRGLFLLWALDKSYQVSGAGFLGLDIVLCAMGLDCLPGDMRKARCFCLGD